MAKSTNRAGDAPDPQDAPDAPVVIQPMEFSPNDYPVKDDTKHYIEHGTVCIDMDSLIKVAKVHFGIDAEPTQTTISKVDGSEMYTIHLQ